MVEFHAVVCYAAILGMAAQALYLALRLVWRSGRAAGARRHLHYRPRSKFCEAVLERCSTLRENYTPPFLWGKSGHVQTFLFGAAGRFFVPEVKGHRHSLIVPDGSTVTYDVFDPDEGKASHTILVCPGIGNSSESDYVRAFVHHCTTKGGFRVAVFNHTGSLKDVPITGNRIFTYGGTGDITAVFDDLCQRYHDNLFIGVGFSMGACVLVRFLGENEERRRKFVCAVSLCQGYDPYRVFPHFSDWSSFRWLYNALITRKHLKTIYRHRHSLFTPSHPQPSQSQSPENTNEIDGKNEPSPTHSHHHRHGNNIRRRSSVTCTCNETTHEVTGRDCNGFTLQPNTVVFPDERKFWGTMSIVHVDEHYTRRVMGFDSCEELYQWTSCVDSLWKIERLPVMLINSMDDPLVPEFVHSIPKDYVEHNQNSIFVCPDYGGHLGFYEGNPLKPNLIGWTERLLVEFFNACVDLGEKAGGGGGGGGAGQNRASPAPEPRLK